MGAGDGRSFEWSLEEGLGVITLDTPDNELNYLGLGALDELDGILDNLEEDSSIEAVIVRSGKKGVFSAGADVSTFTRIKTAEEGMGLSRRLQGLVSRISGSRKKWVAAIDGVAYGGGLELALACDYRLATDSPSTSFAFPEVEIGLIPGGGATQSLPRLIGLKHALDMLLTSRRISARKARSWRLVDELARRKGFEDAIRQAAKRLVAGWHPERDASGFEKFQLLPGMRDVVLARTRHKLFRRTRGNYPAPVAALDCIALGLAQGVEAGAESEARRFGRLVVSRESRNLVWLFQVTRQLQHHETPLAQLVRKLGVVGAGSTSASIAVSSLAFADVMIVDPDESRVAHAKGLIHSILEKRRLGGHLSSAESNRMKAAIRFGSSIEELGDSDLIIDASTESAEAKSEIVARLAESDVCIGIDSGTATVSSIVEAGTSPRNIAGSRFFSPLKTHRLLEIVPIEESTPVVVQTLMRLGSQQGRSVIVAADTPGALVNRLRLALFNEALLMVEARYDPAEIERAMLEFGFQVGPLHLIDEAGLEVTERSLSEMVPSFSRRGIRKSKLLGRLLKAGFEGRRSGAGFFVYSRKRPRSVAPVNRRVAEVLGVSTFRGLARSEYGERLVMTLINEAAWCVRDKVVATPTEVDVGAVLGLAFPPFRGGPLKHIDTFGAGAFVRKLKKLEREHGDRFTPCPLLIKMDEKALTFHRTVREETG